jgi:hypothetical protein
MGKNDIKRSRTCHANVPKIFFFQKIKETSYVNVLLVKLVRIHTKPIGDDQTSLNWYVPIYSDTFL